MVLTIIDTFGFLFRNYYALKSANLRSSKGIPTGMLTGFMNFIASLGKEFPTDYIVFALDSESETFRKKLYPEYKANRKEVEEDLKIQLPIAIDLIKEMGFKMIEAKGYESDDVIASLATLASKKGIDVKIISSDKDMYQLLSEKIKIFDPIKKKEIGERECIEKFNVSPKDFINFQALVGDSSDNIPGVKGVGEKTAAKLINEYHTLENIYENIENFKGALKKRLIEGKESAFLSRELVTLKRDLFDDIDLKEFKYPEVNPILKVADKLMDLDITSVIDRVKKEGLYVKTKEPSKKIIEFKAVTIENEKELFDIIEKIGDRVVAFDTETDSLENPNIVGFSFAFEEDKAYYVPINHNYLGVPKQIDEEVGIEAIKKILGKRVIGHNLKFDFKMLRKYGVKTPTPFADTMILAWLLDPDSKVNLDDVAKRYLNYENIKYGDVVGKNQNFSQIDIKTATKYASEDAFITLKLYEVLNNRLWDEVRFDFENIEMPFINILIDMENEGIKVDIEYLEKLQMEVSKKLEELTNRIYKEAGSEFNIKSPKQLSYILFEVLKLPAKKKTKTGYSTNEKVLNSLKGTHPIIDYILEYRKLDKLLSTYIIPLKEYAKKDKNHKIYTTFLQTGTATGRLSSKNPNLQNIPPSIRDAFVSEKMFVSLDYSQIELRLLAHFSEDENLIRAFLEDKDIHLETAIKIFGEKDASKYRGIAKSINFGLIYGMGAKKLSETINVSLKEAREFIEKYFASFPTVKNFLEKTKLEARKKGYVETLLKRRRFFDFVNASNRVIAEYEREAVNTIFQGSAADIIKKAMVEIKSAYPNSKMILQIHDELIFEIEDKSEANRYKEIMENAFKLKVPLKVGMSFGKRWGELK